MSMMITFSFLGLLSLLVFVFLKKGKSRKARKDRLLRTLHLSPAFALTGLLTLFISPAAILIGLGYPGLIVGYVAFLLPWHRKVRSHLEYAWRAVLLSTDEHFYSDLEFLTGRFRLAGSKLILEFHPDSGEITGQITHGKHAGKTIGELSDVQQHQLLSEYQYCAPVSCALLHLCVPESIAHPYSGQLPELDAGAASCLLGVMPEEGRQEVNRQFRHMIRGFHPDRGGNDNLAALIVSAKTCLLAHIK